MKIVRGYTIDKENLDYLYEKAKREERSVSWLVNKAIFPQKKERWSKWIFIK